MAQNFWLRYCMQLKYFLVGGMHSFYIIFQLLKPDLAFGPTILTPSFSTVFQDYFFESYVSQIISQFINNWSMRNVVICFKSLLFFFSHFSLWFSQSIRLHIQISAWTQCFIHYLYEQLLLLLGYTFNYAGGYASVHVGIILQTAKCVSMDEFDRL